MIAKQEASIVSVFSEPPWYCPQQMAIQSSKIQETGLQLCSLVVNAIKMVCKRFDPLAYNLLAQAMILVQNSGNIGPTF